MIAALCFAAAGLSQTVEGTVLNSVTGEALGGVKVSLDAGGKSVREVVTDGQGAFRVDALPPGEYTAAFTSSGFEGPPRDSAARRPFRVTGGSPVRLDASLTPLARVSGRVIDAAGAPVAGAMVQLLGGPVAYNESSGKEGRFSFDRVSAGRYVLWTQPPRNRKPQSSTADERIAWLNTFFPGVADAQAATRLVVRAGSELWNQDIRLLSAPVHRVRGTVFDASGSPVPRTRVTLGANQGISFRDEDRETYTATDADGNFEFPDVNDGVWRLSAEADTLRAFTVEAMTGHDLERVQLPLSPPFTLRGNVVREIPDGAPVRKAPSLVVLSPAGGGNVYHQGKPGEDGAFEIEGVHPGRYLVRPIQPGPPFYLASIKLGEREILDRQSVDLVSGALPLTIVYKSNGGGVRGTVENCGSAAVVFVPQDPALRMPEFIRGAACGEGGRYEIANMRPGEYDGFAFDRGPGLEEMFFGFHLDQGLLNRAAHVTVRSGEFTSVDLRVTERP